MNDIINLNNNQETTDISSQLSTISTMLGIDVSQNNNDDTIKQELGNKILGYITEGKTSNEIVDELLKNFPNENKLNMKNILTPMIDKTIEEFKVQQKQYMSEIQEKVFHSLHGVITKQQTIDDAIEELVITTPDGPEKEKIKNDLREMFTEAMSSLKPEDLIPPMIKQSNINDISESYNTNNISDSPNTSSDDEHYINKINNNLSLVNNNDELFENIFTFLKRMNKIFQDPEMVHIDQELKNKMIMHLFKTIV